MGCCGFSIARYFLNVGWTVLVVNPADVKKTDRTLSKTDRIDSRMFSNQLKSGILKETYIPSEKEEQFISSSSHANN